MLHKSMKLRNMVSYCHKCLTTLQAAGALRLVCAPILNSLNSWLAPWYIYETILEALTCQKLLTLLSFNRVSGVCTDVPDDDCDQPQISHSPPSHSPPEISPQIQVQIERQPSPPLQPLVTPPTPPPPPPLPPSRGRDSGKGKPEFKCPVCLKLFATRGSLDVHSTIHTGVRPFVCSVCNKSFRHKVKFGFIFNLKKILLFLLLL